MKSVDEYDDLGPEYSGTLGSPESMSVASYKRILLDVFTGTYYFKVDFPTGSQGFLTLYIDEGSGEAEAGNIYDLIAIKVSGSSTVTPLSTKLNTTFGGNRGVYVGVGNLNPYPEEREDDWTSVKFTVQTSLATTSGIPPKYLTVVVSDWHDEELSDVVTPAPYDRLEALRTVHPDEGWKMYDWNGGEGRVADGAAAEAEASENMELAIFNTLPQEWPPPMTFEEANDLALASIPQFTPNGTQLRSSVKAGSSYGFVPIPGDPNTWYYYGAAWAKFGYYFGSSTTTHGSIEGFGGNGVLYPYIPSDWEIDIPNLAFGWEWTDSTPEDQSLLGTPINGELVLGLELDQWPVWVGSNFSLLYDVVEEEGGGDGDYYGTSITVPDELSSWDMTKTISVDESTNLVNYTQSDGSLLLVQGVTEEAFSSPDIDHEGNFLKVLWTLQPPNFRWKMAADPVWPDIPSGRTYVRQYPRDDTGGFNSSPRVFPPPKSAARRVFGGFMRLALSTVGELVRLNTLLRGLTVPGEPAR